MGAPRVGGPGELNYPSAQTIQKMHPPPFFASCSATGTTAACSPRWTRQLLSAPGIAPFGNCSLKDAAALRFSIPVANVASAQIKY